MKKIITPILFCFVLVLKTHSSPIKITVEGTVTFSAAQQTISGVSKQIGGIPIVGEKVQYVLQFDTEVSPLNPNIVDEFLEWEGGMYMKNNYFEVELLSGYTMPVYYEGDKTSNSFGRISEINTSNFPDVEFGGQLSAVTAFQNEYVSYFHGMAVEMDYSKEEISWQIGAEFHGWERSNLTYMENGSYTNNWIVRSLGYDFVITDIEGVNPVSPGKEAENVPEPKSTYLISFAFLCFVFLTIFKKNKVNDNSIRNIV